MILIVASRFDKSENSVIESLLLGVINVLENNIENNIENNKKQEYQVLRVSGANEIPATIQHFISKYPNKFSVAIALGLIIKGETDHYEMVRDSSTMGITQLSLRYNFPIIQGILACHNKNQAIERKYLGKEFGMTALEMQKIKKL
ncbi:TPA: hypothetical protein EYP45_01680 [Candidatus Peregrinibacteria bacterium]|nr:hypothetical protein [Candidatus Peregrinibacteria bacterium]